MGSDRNLKVMSEDGFEVEFVENKMGDCITILVTDTRTGSTSATPMPDMHTYKGVYARLRQSNERHIERLNSVEHAIGVYLRARRK